MIVNSTAAAAGQHLGPEVIGFALRAVGPREHRRRPARRGDPLQAGRHAIGCDDDRVIRSPGRAGGAGGVECRQRDRRPTGHRHFLQHAEAVHESDPLPIGGNEQPARARR